MLKVKQHAFISGQGKRQNNEDNFGIYGQSTFVVCDGVGGAEKGEIASDLVAKTFIHALKENPERTAAEIIGTAEQALSDYAATHPESFGMATTLTLTHVRPNGMYVAWCGDSRIYQFRKGALVFKSVDHSWVNEALAAGIITAEEAVNHPKSNIITRAIQGKHKPAEVQDVFLNDIQKGDRFLLCSDGVLESWSDRDLQALFNEDFSPEKHLEVMQQECEQHSKDNFTAIVLEIEQGVAPQEQFVVNVPEQPAQQHPEPAANRMTKQPETKKGKARFGFAEIVVAAFLFAGAFFAGKYWPVEEKQEEKKHTPATVESKKTNSQPINWEAKINKIEDSNRENSKKIEMYKRLYSNIGKDYDEVEKELLTKLDDQRKKLLENRLKQLERNKTELEDKIEELKSQSSDSKNEKKQ
jgi:serine/threonine protein phosphatase PrpC